MLIGWVRDETSLTVVTCVYPGATKDRLAIRSLGLAYTTVIWDKVKPRNTRVREVQSLWGYKAQWLEHWSEWGQGLAHLQCGKQGTARRKRWRGIRPPAATSQCQALGCAVFCGTDLHALACKEKKVTWKGTLFGMVWHSSHTDKRKLSYQRQAVQRCPISLLSPGPAVWRLAKTQQVLKMSGISYDSGGTSKWGEELKRNVTSLIQVNDL